jgi:hypothetical protein
MSAAELADALLGAEPAQRERLLDDATPEDIATAIALLGQRRVQAAADALNTIEASSGDRALRKSARRELHRLRSAGVEAHADAAAIAPPTVTSAARAEQAVAVSEAWATDVDPSGSRALWLLGMRPLGGAWFAAVLLNELRGVLDLSLIDTTRKRFQRELEDRRRTPGTWVRLPGEYALRLVREAVDVGREAGTALPTRYAAFREVFGEADGPPPRALVFETVSPVDASLSPELLEESQALVREPEITGWSVILPEALRGRALEVARSQQAALVVPGNSPPQQALHLLADVAQEALTPRVRHAFSRRLEETAYIFVSTDRLLAARRAVAAAKALEDRGRPIERNPFARVLIEAGLGRALRTEQVGGRPAPEVLFEMIEGAIEQAREGNRGGVEARPSGLILPR